MPDMKSLQCQVMDGVHDLPRYASIFATTLPPTSVRRKSRPWKR